MGVIIEMHKNENTLFPENKIILLNGNTLDCYPVEEEVEVVEDNLKLDTTGQYFSVGGRRLKPVPPTPKEEEEQCELFVKNAFYLLAHRERILNDSRMFLCPVHVKNGLAYTGTSGFHNPTLGIYIEWWQNCQGAMLTEKKGKRGLVYHLAGSPLSGANHCVAICEDGKKKDITLLPFRDYWPVFMGINQRYTEAKCKYQAYNLQQVLDILKHEDNGGVDSSLTLETDFLRHEIMTLRKQLETLKKDRDNWYEKYNELLVKKHETKMRVFYKEYHELEVKTNIEIEQLREQKKGLKAELKSGRLSNIDYQRQLTPINKRIKELESGLSYFKHQKIREMFPDGDVSFMMIEKQFKTDKD